MPKREGEVAACAATGKNSATRHPSRIPVNLIDPLGQERLVSRANQPVRCDRRIELRSAKNMTPPHGGMVTRRLDRFERHSLRLKVADLTQSTHPHERVGRIR